MPEPQRRSSWSTTDLRDPIAIVRGLITILRTDPGQLSPEERALLWDALDRQAARLWAILDDIDVIDLDHLAAAADEPQPVGEASDPKP